jgi:hypothetical protein
MRRLALAAVLVACVLAVMATPAIAHKVAGVSDRFTGSEAVEPRFTSPGTQDFAFKPFTVTCEQAKSAKTGLIPAWPAESLFAEVKFSGRT